MSRVGSLGPPVFYCSYLSSPNLKRRETHHLRPRCGPVFHASLPGIFSQRLTRGDASHEAGMMNTAVGRSATLAFLVCSVACGSSGPTSPSRISESQPHLHRRRREGRGLRSVFLRRLGHRAPSSSTANWRTPSGTSRGSRTSSSTTTARSCCSTHRAVLATARSVDSTGTQSA